LKLLDLQLKGPMGEVKEHEKHIDRYCPHKIATVTSLGLGLQENYVPIKTKLRPNMATLVIASYVLA
jgi:hypothetical protein